MATEKPDISQVLNGILSNPEALSSIMSIMSNVGNQKDKEEKRDAPQKEEIPTVNEALPVFNTQPSIPVIAPFKHNERSRERELLLALKPFLSNRKCETIDTFVRLLDIVSLLGGVK